MTATVDPVTLPLIDNHDNAYNLQAAVDGVPQSLQNKTITAALTYTGVGSPLQLTLASGLAITDTPNGKFKLTLTQAEIANMDLAKPIYCYLTIWNADNSAWAHGKFPLVKTLG